MNTMYEWDEESSYKPVKAKIGDTITFKYEGQVKVGTLKATTRLTNTNSSFYSDRYYVRENKDTEYKIGQEDILSIVS